MQQNIIFGLFQSTGNIMNLKKGAEKVLPRLNDGITWNALNKSNNNVITTVLLPFLKYSIPILIKVWVKQCVKNKALYRIICAYIQLMHAWSSK